MSKADDDYHKQLVKFVGKIARLRPYKPLEDDPNDPDTVSDYNWDDKIEDLAKKARDILT